MTAYYNENDPFAAAWLRELIKANLIAPGEVDERSIEEVKADDLRGFTQCHFFAGIGVWSYALRNAGWSDDSPVWTGSCPCQSFSASGKRGGFSDKRHLWPTWFRLISECRPVTIFGEQVSQKNGLAWLDVVSADVEGSGYAIGSLSTSAAGVGAPHIRQRLYFVADAPGRRREQRYSSERSIQFINENSELGNTELQGLEGFAGNGNHRNEPGRLGENQTGPVAPSGHLNFWSDAEWIYCKDGKYRPVKPGLPVLVNGTPNRVGRLRGYGNAINAEQAKAFIEAYMELDQ